MIESALSLYKLIVLYMLEQAKFPLTNAQISSFVIGGQYTTYLRLQEVFAELVSSGLISVKPLAHTTYYSITEQGRQTVSFFHSEISDRIKEEINAFIEKNSAEMRDNAHVSAVYSWSARQGYEVQCTVSEGDVKLLSLSMTVPTEAAAKLLCDNWKKKYAEAYTAVMKLLL